jgi:AraC-like DNA-binding protein
MLIRRFRLPERPAHSEIEIAKHTGSAYNFGNAKRQERINVPRFTTLNEVKRLLKGIYPNQSMWKSLTLSEISKRALLPDDPNMLILPEPDRYFGDMSDEEFIENISNLPIFIPEDTSMLDQDFRACYPSGEVFAFPVPNYMNEPVHKHGFYEINHVLRGECLQFFEDERRVLPQGSVSILSPGSRHRFLIDTDECCAVRICLDPDLFGKMFFEILSSNKLLMSFFMMSMAESAPPNYILFSMGQDKHIRNIIKTVFFETYLSDNYSRAGALSGINMLFCHLLRNYVKSSIFQSSEKKGAGAILQILSFIERNYASITLRELSRRFHFTEAHMSRVIKGKTGRNFSLLVQELKLEKAREFLSNTTMTIGAITESVGYGSQSYLTRAFKCKYGVVPSKYRDNYSGQSHS